jgi:TRAP-type C4-dicarboxylate transport system substrate-binding protein
MFVTAGETDQFDLMKSAGYTPVALEWTDALTSLQTKMIDALPTIPYFALTAQLYTVANYMLDLNWAPVAGGLIINEKTWNSMPADVQAAVLKAAVDAGNEIQTKGRAESDAAVVAMQKRGLTVVPIPPAVEAEWRKTSEALYPKIRGSMVPADMFDEVVRLLAEYRSGKR